MSIDRTDSVVTEWFARPVLHVSSVEASLRFYVDRLGFTVPWRAGTDGHVDVAQVDVRAARSFFPNTGPRRSARA